MSTNLDVYVMVGVDLLNDIDVDELDILLEDSKYNFSPRKGEYGLVYDGMCGKYLIAGQVLSVSRVYDGEDMSMIDFSPARLESAIAGVDEWVRETFGEEYGINRPSSLKIFFHWS